METLSEENIFDFNFLHFFDGNFENNYLELHKYRKSEKESKANSQGNYRAGITSVGLRKCTNKPSVEG